MFSPKRADVQIWRTPLSLSEKCPHWTTSHPPDCERLLRAVPYVKSEVLLKW